MSKLILIRHGQSTANVDRTVYDKVPDHKIALTSLGHQQTTKTGENLCRIITPQETTLVLHSPYLRALQSCTNITNVLKEHTQNLIVEEELLIREQSLRHSYRELREPFDYMSSDKTNYGSFWFKEGTGESLVDVYTRAKLFIYDLDKYSKKYDNIILVSHGMFLNVLQLALDRIKVEDFSMDGHLRNAEMCVREYTCE